MMESAAFELTQRLAGSLLHFVWQGSLLGVMAAIGLRLSANRPPEFRYTFAAALLFGMLAAPLLTFVLYAETGAIVAWLLQWAGHAAEGDANTAAWIQWIVSAWMIGVSGCSLRLFAGWIVSWRLTRTATVAEEAIVRMFEEIRERLAVKVPVRLLISARVHGPAAIGWLRPVVLLPVSALSGLDERQLRAVFAHELAHIRRHDFAVNVLQRCVETVLFYHPVVWWLSSKVRQEREHCADDLAALACGDR
jgi:beta-lactamase regulating signal transducer with metallopeptidase domain